VNRDASIYARNARWAIHLAFLFGWVSFISGLTFLHLWLVREGDPAYILRQTRARYATVIREINTENHRAEAYVTRRFGAHPTGNTYCMGSGLCRVPTTTGDYEVVCNNRGCAGERQ
jgi:hypothetical protein